ncbi:MAG TPA: electron transfer flavoprotein subunit alpha/FixB family protein [Steroidobacteraceae bacterium]|jgi:electron transfer flavoprotein alpha subunit|nr:electron transfer flavoprotein subunit alpha/FixB family protein [Steroidobacteraceae bacterium]
MTQILIVAEHGNGRLNPSTAKCVSCAQSFGEGTIDIALLAADVAPLAAEAAALMGVRRVLTLERPENAEPLAAVYAPQVAALAEGYTHLLGPSTTFGKDLMPRVAALLGVGQISDVMTVESANRFVRPVYAGNALMTVEAPAGQIAVATVRMASFQPAAGGGSASIEAATVEASLPSHTRFLSRTQAKSDRPDLQTAKRVVSGGRALASAENFKLLYGLADALGAAVGASRAAVDAGYVPNEMQVGQTGKIIAPELYVALGISGAIQHLTGIKDARTIVAVNKDSEAPIFEVADIGMVGDLFQVVPELERLLRAEHR